MTNNNPFLYGNPVASADFYDRKEEVNRVVGRLLNKGQSTAIVGGPRTGKTSLLHYLFAPTNRAKLYGAPGEQMLFSFLDVQTLGGQFTPAQFWEQALAPVKAQLVDPHPDSALARQYQLSRENHFGNFTLEILFRQLWQAGGQLVLLIDEFEMLLSHPILDNAEFFGGLRSLTSRSGGTLSLVVASRLPLVVLNAQTQPFNPTGSPFFNIFDQVTLGPFQEREVAALLYLAGDRFTVADKRAIHTLAGNYPFLLQATAAAMWDAWAGGLQEAGPRYRAMARRLYREQALHFGDSWRVWPPATRKAFISVALADIDHLLPGQEFLTTSFIQRLRNWGPELSALAAAGLLLADKQTPGGWRIAAQVMLWWLVDDLTRHLRPETPFVAWLQMEQLASCFSSQEQEEFEPMLRSAVQALPQGAMSLIERFVGREAGGGQS